ncbi:reverse transcriptase/maturase family protein [Leptospira ellinghausenii]|uniref:reverse transcriptase/maturase family protein n=1 Tax=Leptospira ellinghausenii TaxID=1917822 RepID=UPI000D5A097B|nr:reverse transcriptase/maturase family protein [Leptospira ellinghausenii]
MEQNQSIKTKEPFEPSLSELLNNIWEEVNAIGFLKSNPMEQINLGIIFKLLSMLKRKSKHQKSEISEWYSNSNLATELLIKCKGNRYEFGTAKQTTIKTNGKNRVIYSYRISDKIVQKFISIILNEIWNPEFYPTSFAYRSNMSIKNGMKLIEKQSKEDNYSTKLDIHKCFNNIDTVKLIEIIEVKIKHPQFLKIINKSLITYTKFNGKKVKHFGIPAGSVHAPIMANLYLHNLLDKPSQEKFPDISNIFRYADDILIVTKEESTNNQINQWVEDTLKNSNLTISEKTPNVTSELKNGQHFLGYRITKEQDQLVIDIDQERINRKILELCLTKPEYLPNYLRSQIKSTHISSRTLSSWHSILVSLPYVIRKELRTKLNPGTIETILAKIEPVSKLLLRELESATRTKTPNQCITNQSGKGG